MEFSVEARYPHQVWELEVPLAAGRIRSNEELRKLCDAFHSVHRDVFAIADESSHIEFESWHARARCGLQEPARPQVEHRSGGAPIGQRDVYLPDLGATAVDVWRIDSLPVSLPRRGPAIIESETTTIVVEHDATFARQPSGTIHVSFTRDGSKAELTGASNQARES